MGRNLVMAYKLAACNALAEVWSSVPNIHMTAYIYMQYQFQVNSVSSFSLCWHTRGIIACRANAYPHF